MILTASAQQRHAFGCGLKTTAFLVLTAMKEANQITRRREDVRVQASDLLAVTEGKITEEGLRWNIDVGLQYLESWLRGSGCVPIYNLMEDAATAEICRSQVWQWVKHGASLSDGRPVTQDMLASFS